MADSHPQGGKDTSGSFGHRGHVRAHSREQLVVSFSSAQPEPSSNDDLCEKSKDPVVPEFFLPIHQSIALALVYMFGCIAFFLLIRYTKSHRRSDYDPTAAVFCIELLKWIFSVAAMFYRTGKFLPLSVWRDGTWRVGLYYAVPSGIYALYNNLTFANLTFFDPGTYQVFMQTRVIFTGILYTWVLKKVLTRRKWGALCLLTFGVMVKYITVNLQIDWRVLLMLLQASLSAFAGVYNEYLLKDQMQMDVNEQNFFMYSFALFFNLGFGMWSNPTYYFTGRVFLSFTSKLLLTIVVIGATVGIVTSLLLKFLNVIVKAFASAMEVILTAYLAALLMGEPLTMQDFAACCVVIYAIYIYYRQGPLCPSFLSCFGASSSRSPQRTSAS